MWLMGSQEETGDRWRLLQIFARDCQPYFLSGIAVSQDIAVSHAAVDPTKVICTNAYSEVHPLSGGAMVLDVLKTRFRPFLGPFYVDEESLYKVRWHVFCFELCT